jgi:hypothetical protein
VTVGSLAYRKNEAAIIEGDVPAKYTRIVPHVPGKRILEIGSAEGVLALLLAKEGKQVTALEKNPCRHRAALELCRNWFERDRDFIRPHYVNGSIGDSLELLDGIDTLVAVRMIYYLGADIDRIFAAIARKVPNVVLCGNRNRADRCRTGQLDEPLGGYNLYASKEGMRMILEKHGYRIVKQITEGDEIVVGYMD